MTDSPMPVSPPTPTSDTELKEYLKNVLTFGQPDNIRGFVNEMSQHVATHKPKHNQRNMQDTIAAVKAAAATDGKTLSDEQAKRVMRHVTRRAFGMDAQAHYLPTIAGNQNYKMAPTDEALKVEWRKQHYYIPLDIASGMVEDILPQHSLTAMAQNGTKLPWDMELKAQHGQASQEDQENVYSELKQRASKSPKGPKLADFISNSINDLATATTVMPGRVVRLNAKQYLSREQGDEIVTWATTDLLLQEHARIEQLLQGNAHITAESPLFEALTQGEDTFRAAFKQTFKDTHFPLTDEQIDTALQAFVNQDINLGIYGSDAGITQMWQKSAHHTQQARFNKASETLQLDSAQLQTWDTAAPVSNFQKQILASGYTYSQLMSMSEADLRKANLQNTFVLEVLHEQDQFQKLKQGVDLRTGVGTYSANLFKGQVTFSKNTPEDDAPLTREDAERRDAERTVIAALQQDKIEQINAPSQDDPGFEAWQAEQVKKRRTKIRSKHTYIETLPKENSPNRYIAYMHEDGISSKNARPKEPKSGSVRPTQADLSEVSPIMDALNQPSDMSDQQGTSKITPPTPAEAAKTKTVPDVQQLADKVMKVTTTQELSDIDKQKIDDMKNDLKESQTKEIQARQQSQSKDMGAQIYDHLD